MIKTTTTTNKNNKLFKKIMKPNHIKKKERKRKLIG